MSKRRTFRDLKEVCKWNISEFKDFGKYGKPLKLKTYGCRPKVYNTLAA